MLSKYSSLFNTNKPKVLRTNIKLLDDSIGGGLPIGKITELVGKPDVGKTTLLFDIIESLRNDDIVICYIATSVKSLGYLKARGLDSNNKLILCVSSVESQIMELIKKSIKSVDLFIIDSMPQILTNNESNGFDMNINQDMPKMLQELSGIFYGENSALIAVNYITFKNNEAVSRWRNIFNQYCTVRIEVKSKNRFKLLSHKLQPRLVGGEKHGV